MDLPRWDRLGGGRRADLEVHASLCSRCGPRLELLKLAEAWLEECGVKACPPAELLYDFGGGPGHLPLPAAESGRVAEHLEHCPTCVEFVEGLASAPPSPLELEAHPPIAARRSSGPRPLFPLRRGPWSTESWARILPLAAAAALLLFVTFWNPPQSSPHELAMATLADLERPATMRGAGDTTLVAPRDKLLAVLDADGKAVPARPLVFEIAPPREGAGEDAPLATTGYRVRVFAQVDDPFEEGRLIREFVSNDPLIEAPELLLPPGHYTWEAWAKQGKVESRIDGRDFSLVVDTAFLASLESFEALAEPLRSAKLVDRMHSAGYLSDARALVRAMPDGPERDAYLEAFPAR